MPARLKEVLIVDDEGPFLFAIAEGLSIYKNYFKVHTALDGEEAVKVLETSPAIDLVVTGLCLPGMDGYELFAHMKKYYPNIPAILMSGSGTPNIKNISCNMGFVRFFEKPLDIVMLAASIFDVLSIEPVKEVYKKVNVSSNWEKVLKFFKKKIHEPMANQRADLTQYPDEFARLVASGLDCDSLPGATGPFGAVSNPIPVNGAIGEIKYLGKLRGKSGFALFFHRIGSAFSPVSKQSVDVYETVCMDGSQRSILYFDMYHPRRSNLSPADFTLNTFDRQLKMDLPYAYGVNSFVRDFPYGLPEALVKLYGEFPGDAFARHTQEKLDKYDFHK